MRFRAVIALELVSHPPALPGDEIDRAIAHSEIYGIMRSLDATAHDLAQGWEVQCTSLTDLEEVHDEEE